MGRLAAPETLAALAAFEADLICVACFPRILPPPLLALPRLGGFNVHPSLLPANRGPAPLFWTFRLGETTTGVSVHALDAGIDSGDLILQEALPVPEGIRGPELMRSASRCGGRLLLEAVGRLASRTLERRPQDPSQATYHSWPTPDDFRVPATASARWAFNFIRGVTAWGRPTIEVAGQVLPVRDALSYTPEATLAQPYRVLGSDLEVRFAPGVLIARL